jgi:hypothetical protein
MKWIDETSKHDASQVRHVLVLQEDEPLPAAYAEFWKRILTDARTFVAEKHSMSLNFDIVDKQSEDDGTGHLQAVFRDGQQNECKGVGCYRVRGEAFTCLELPDEEGQDFDEKEIRFFLEHYKLLKEAARNSEVQTLFDVVKPLRIQAATCNGWFDLRMGEDAFGRLPSEDQALLAGQEPAPANPLKNLMGGIIDVEKDTLMQELHAALIAYTPPTFEVIVCSITEGLEQGKPALFYDIQCPQLPDEGTNVVNQRVHQAATRVVQYLKQEYGPFTGMITRLELQKDGNWLSSLKLMSRAEPAA